MTSLHPNTFPELRGQRAAERAIKEAVSATAGDGTPQITDNEVRKVFASADQYMPNGEQVSLGTSLKLALQLLKNDLTKEGITAVFARFGIEPPVDNPVITPDPGDIVVRPRYGLMETARPIVDRVDAGTASEEDKARLHILKALADRGADATPRIRGRAGFNQPVGVRSLGGTDAMAEARAFIGGALDRAG
jgi:hypothetical protein